MAIPHAGRAERTYLLAPARRVSRLDRETQSSITKEPESVKPLIGGTSDLAIVSTTGPRPGSARLLGLDRSGRSDRDNYEPDSESQSPALEQTHLSRRKFSAPLPAGRALPIQTISVRFCACSMEDGGGAPTAHSRCSQPAESARHSRRAPRLLRPGSYARMSCAIPLLRRSKPAANRRP